MQKDGNFGGYTELQGPFECSWAAGLFLTETALSGCIGPALQSSVVYDFEFTCNLNVERFGRTKNFFFNESLYEGSITKSSFPHWKDVGLNAKWGKTNTSDITQITIYGLRGWALVTDLQIWLLLKYCRTLRQAFFSFSCFFFFASSQVWTSD